MYRKQFYYSGKYKQSKKDINEQIQFFDEPEPLYEYFDLIKDYTLNKLVEEYTGVEIDLEKEDLSDELEQHYENQLEICGQLIAFKLGLNYNFDWLIDSICENLELIENAFKELENYKSHRHRTVLGLYTEKAVY